MKTIDKILTKVSSKYGAPMGRQDVCTCDKEVINGETYVWCGNTFDCRVKLDKGGYDKGGAYWGIGAELRVQYNKDLTYVRFYRYGNK